MAFFWAFTDFVRFEDIVVNLPGLDLRRLFLAARLSAAREDRAVDGGRCCLLGSRWGAPVAALLQEIREGVGRRAVGKAPAEEQMFCSIGIALRVTT